MRFAAGNAQHMGARPQQQDAFGFSDPSDRTFVAHAGFLGVVADGVGGLTHGSEASQSAVHTFLQAYHLKSANESIPDALARSLREANAAVLRAASAPSAEGAGTTLVAAALHDQSLYWISAGDSRIYLLHGNRLTRVTSDHTYARELDEQAAQGKISRAEAQNHAERGSLTSYLGQPHPKEVDRNTRPLAIQADDCVILCSDGFYRALDEPEIVGAFRNDPQKACDSLVHQVVAKQRKQQDNLTVIALKYRTKNGRWGAPQRGHERSRLRSFVLSALVLAAFSAAAGYWYERTSPDAKQAVQPQTPGTQANPDNSASGQQINSKPEEIPPRLPKAQPAAKHNAARHHQAVKSKGDSTNTNSKIDTTEPPKPAEVAPAPPPAQDQGAPADGTAAPAVPPNDQAPPPGQSPGAGEKTSPSGQVPDSQEKQQTVPAPPAPDKPPVPPGLASARDTRSNPQTARKIFFCAPAMSRLLGIKDDDQSCRS